MKWAFAVQKSMGGKQSAAYTELVLKRQLSTVGRGNKIRSWVGRVPRLSFFVGFDIKPTTVFRHVTPAFTI